MLKWSVRLKCRYIYFICSFIIQLKKCTTKTNCLREHTQMKMWLVTFVFHVMSFHEVSSHGSAVHKTYDKQYTGIVNFVPKDEKLTRSKIREHYGSCTYLLPESFCLTNLFDNDYFWDWNKKQRDSELNGFYLWSINLVPELEYI